MEHLPADFAQIMPGATPQDVGERRDALLAALPPCPGLPSTEAEIAASDARAMADYRAGRCYDHKVVSAWLTTMPVHGLRFRDWIAGQNG